MIVKGQFENKNKNLVEDDTMFCRVEFKVIINKIEFSKKIF